MYIWHCVDLAFPWVLRVEARVSTQRPNSKEERTMRRSRRSLSHGGTWGGDLNTSLPERHLCHSRALLPVSLQHLPSSLSYKSQRPLLFQVPQRERRERGGVVLTDMDSLVFLSHQKQFKNLPLLTHTSKHCTKIWQARMKVSEC